VGVLFAVFGLVFIAFAIVALLVGSSPSLMLGHVVLGAGFLLYALVTSFREIRDFLAQGVPGRSARYGGNVLLQTVIVIAILVMVAFVSVRNPVKWDWTEAGVHSLSPATLEVLEQIPEDPGIEILAFFVAGSGEGARAVFDRYTYRSDRVKVRFVDPNARPELAQRHDVRTNGVILVCAGPCGAAEGSTRVAQPTEQELTSAIRSVISDKRKVYFVTGHGEASVEDSEASGLSRIKTALEDENIDVATLLLAREPGVPEDADAVVVAGPTQRFLDRELSALDGYLRGGGSILFLSEPFHALNLQAQVREWGIELGDDVIVDQQIQLFAGPKLGVQPIVNEYGSHPITELQRKSGRAERGGRARPRRVGGRPHAAAAGGRRARGQARRRRRLRLRDQSLRGRVLQRRPAPQHDQLAGRRGAVHLDRPQAPACVSRRDDDRSVPELPIPVPVRATRGDPARRPPRLVAAPNLSRSR
jgi:ABC-type uncharacterized transport system involved in gliding motility auxiliary subunit